MSDPNKSYHFEIVCTISEIAEQIRSVYAVLVLTLRLYAEKSLMLFIRRRISDSRYIECNGSACSSYGIGECKDSERDA